MTFPCELEEGDKINIDVKSDESLYREFLDRNQLHAFFTATEADTYLVVVRNNSLSQLSAFQL